jgi:hypothetical protein
MKNSSLLSLASRKDSTSKKNKLYLTNDEDIKALFFPIRQARNGSVNCSVAGGAEKQQNTLNMNTHNKKREWYE